MTKTGWKKVDSVDFGGTEGTIWETINSENISVFAATINDQNNNPILPRYGQIVSTSIKEVIRICHCDLDYFKHLLD